MVGPVTSHTLQRNAMALSTAVVCPWPKEVPGSMISKTSSSTQTVLTATTLNQTTESSNTPIVYLQRTGVCGLNQTTSPSYLIDDGSLILATI